MNPQSEYVYGIIEASQTRKFSFPGIGGADVYTINHGQLAAVVSDTELSEIDPIRRNVQAHTVVQEELLKEYSLLPMSFGMVAKGKSAVRTLLEENYDALLGELRRLDAKIEVELKVFWDQEAVTREIQSGSQALSRIKAGIDAASSPFEVQNLLSTAGKLVEATVQDWKSRYAELVYAILKKLSSEAKVNNPVGIKNLLNASFLIDRTREDEFREEVYKLDTRFQSRMNFKYVGPLPPYNFVNLKLEPMKC